MKLLAEAFRKDDLAPPSDAQGGTNFPIPDKRPNLSQMCLKRGRVELKKGKKREKTTKKNIEMSHAENAKALN